MATIQQPRVAIVGAAAVVTLALAGCGGDSGGRDATSTTTSPARAVDAAQIERATAEQSIEEELDAQGASNAQVNCPDTITVKVDTTVTCDLSGASGQAAGSVTFTFSDASGTVDSSSVQTG